MAATRSGRQSVRDEIVTRLRSGEIAAAKDRHREPGVVLVGGGPGDPDLITVAGRRALQEADVVVTDRLAPQQLLAELAPDVELIDATKLPRGRAASQDAINAVLIDRAKAGKSVVRFKGGDPFVFGRGYEELLACAAAGVACRIIPGITSAISVPALGGVPVTHRGVAHEFTVLSGHLPPDHPDSLIEWDALAKLRGTLVMLMAVENVGAIASALMAAGKPAGYAGCGDPGRIAGHPDLSDHVPGPDRGRRRTQRRPPASDHRGRRRRRCRRRSTAGVALGSRHG